MKILRVVGLGLAIIMLKFLVPTVFHGIENTFLSFLHTLDTIFSVTNGSLEAGVSGFKSSSFAPKIR
jgi:hypothetical protein